ncbi:hypothetical protein ABZ806_08475 [Spirillospora sp. NPDC047418]|jgi:hypothetical protein
MKQAKALDAAWDTGGHFERLLFFARALHNPDWFRQSVGYEVKARILRIYQGQAIPVPLQSEDYLARSCRWLVLRTLIRR